MTNERRRYCSYLLRLWQASEGETAEWRITLEDVQTRARHNFADVDALAAFLVTQVQRGVLPETVHLTEQNENL